MTFDEVLAQVQELLQREQRVSYRGLKRRFALDDEYLEDLKEELIGAKRLAVDEDGRFLVWIGNAEEDKGKWGNEEKDSPGSRVQSLESKEQRQIPTVSTLDSRRQTLDTAERRQLTVMFCDLVGSTALSAQLDPEELREVVQAYQETCAKIIQRYAGHIAQHLGDGLLVYFGYPSAHEDDATRAVRAGLEILTDLQFLNARLPSMLRARLPHPMQVRIGIHTGLVVIGELGSSEKREILALGETPNLAARIQGQANPDEVVISAATYRLVEGMFEAEDRGQPPLKGVATPLTLYRVRKESEAHSRFEVVVRKGLTPLIGREHEYGLLHERWQRVKDGTGQVVLLSGEPGIGKSRLVEALKETVEHEGAHCLELRCSPYAQNSALQPVIEHLRRTLQFRPEDSADEKLRKLTTGATDRSSLQTEAIALLASFLSLPHLHGHPPLTLSPQKQKEKTLEALATWLCTEARQQAVMYAWEDLHWADPSTLELLTLFLAQVPTTRVLTMLTFRPEFTSPWGSHSYLSQLTLSRLGQSQVEVMVEKVTGSKALPREVIRQITSKTDGVPLFVEELTKMVVESDLVREVNGHYELSGPLPPLAIPSTLQDSLMARLDRLTTVREIAQIGATIGREFTYELLQAVALLQEDILQQGLKQLVEAELVFQSGIPPQARYLFKHALVQDTAYQSLLKSRRQQLHQQVAQVLAARFPEIVQFQPELLAHHYTEAGLTAQAIPYWQQAGQNAVARSANIEAIRHLTTGLELLKTLPDASARAQQELTLQLALVTPLTATKGYAAPEAGEVFARARVLCQQMGETLQFFPILFAYRFYLHRGELQTARELVEQCLSLAQHGQDPARLLLAHMGLGAVSYNMGEFAPAREHLEQGIALYDPRQHSLHTSLYGTDPGVICLSVVALTLWSMGYLAQALKRSNEALTLARKLSHPFSLSYAEHFAAWFHQLRCEEHALQELVEVEIARSREQGFSYMLACGTLLEGWLLTEQGEGQEGLAQIGQSLSALRATGTELRPYHLALLAQAYRKVGQAKEGLGVVAEALATARKTGERWYEAEVWRLRGELVLQSPVQNSDPSLKEAEACFHRAIELARKQEAKLWELRAAISLARLWQQQGKRAQAHKLLLEVYNWFTEGFDTKDLQEAKALLESLESRV